MIPKWLWNKRIGVYDLETDYIPTTQIFCNSISFINIDAHGNYTITPASVYTQYWTPYTNGSLIQSVTLLNECDYVCAHNLMSFDIVEVPKHLGTVLTAQPLDTLILSKLIFSQDELYRIDDTLQIDSTLHGGYSLKAFGQRFGDHKIDYTDFSHLNKEMAIYCNKDTDLAAQLLIFLLEKPNFPPQEVIELEHKAAKIIQEQTEAGFYIDIDHLKELNSTLLKEKGELARELSTMFSPKFLKQGNPKKYKKLSKSRKYLPNTKYIPLIGTKGSYHDL